MRLRGIILVALVTILILSSNACTSTSVSNPTTTPTQTQTNVSTSTPTPEWIGPNGEKECENVYTKVIGGDGQPIQLDNNPQARDPSWYELRSFLEQDNTDRQSYEYQSFVCTDFAEMLHNNAEAAGIRAAYVTIRLSGCNDSDNDAISYNCGHALNAFNTTDNGLVYIDATGKPASNIYSCSYDKKVEVSVGGEYIAVAVFSCTGWSSHWMSMGTVTDVDVQW